jgi:hypothetical protein
MMSVAHTIDSLGLAIDSAQARVVDTAAKHVLAGKPDAHRAKAFEDAKAELGNLHAIIAGIPAEGLDGLKAKAKLCKRYFGDAPCALVIQNLNETDAVLVASVLRDVIALAS